MSFLKKKIKEEAERLEKKGYGSNEAERRAEKAFEAEKRRIEDREKEKNNR